MYLISRKHDESHDSEIKTTVFMCQYLQYLYICLCVFLCKLNEYINKVGSLPCLPLQSVTCELYRKKKGGKFWNSISLLFRIKTNLNDNKNIISSFENIFNQVLRSIYSHKNSNWFSFLNEFLKIKVHVAAALTPNHAVPRVCLDGSLYHNVNSKITKLRYSSSFETNRTEQCLAQ